MCDCKTGPRNLTPELFLFVEGRETRLFRLKGLTPKQGLTPKPKSIPEGRLLRLWLSDLVYET